MGWFMGIGSSRDCKKTEYVYVVPVYESYNVSSIRNIFTKICIVSFFGAIPLGILEGLIYTIFNIGNIIDNRFVPVLFFGCLILSLLSGFARLIIAAFRNEL